MKVIKDLLYGGRNEYLDVVRVLALLGGLTFLILGVLDFLRRGTFDAFAYSASWSTLLGATTGAIYARNRSDRRQREQDQSDQRPKGENA